MKIDLVNETKTKVNKADIGQWVDEELARHHFNFAGDIEVMIVSPEKIQEMNREYRHKDAVTDVLSFPLMNKIEKSSRVDHLGTIVVCAEQARKQAALKKQSLDNELKMLVKHSVRHLLGIHHPE